MSLHRLTRSIRRFLSRVSAKKAHAGRRAAARLGLLALEDRVTPATYTGTISGVAFIDGNSNGAREANELALPGATFTLQGRSLTGVTVRANVTTGPAGGFRFNNVLPGSYQVIANPIAAGFQPLSANGALLPGAVGGAKVVLTRALGAGKTLGASVGFRPQGTALVSLNLFLNTSSPSSATLPFVAPGSGSTAVNFRPNDLPTVVDAIEDFTASKNAADQSFSLANVIRDKDFTNTIVRMQTSAGTVNMKLFDELAPLTVANFLRYVEANRYDSSIFHRLGTFLHSSGTPRDVLQGGQFKFSSQNGQGNLTQIPLFGNVPDEVNLPNTARTISMAKTGAPNSATSQFFFNLVDNTGPLSAPPQTNGGFTVFAEYFAVSQSVVSSLSGFNVQDKSSFNGALQNLPLRAGAGAGSAFPGNTRASDYTLIRDVNVVKRNTETMRFTVQSNTNTGLVTPVIEGQKLTLKYAPNATGTAKITLKGTDRFGASVTTSFTVTVGNDAPTATTPTLNPTTVNTNTVLTANTTTNDANGDPVTLTHVWKKNGVVIPNETGNTLDLSKPGYGDKGDNITVEITPNDGIVNGATVSASRLIVDSAPTISLLSFNPDPPGTNSLLTVTPTATDLDGDEITFTYRWLVNNVVVPGSTNTLDLSIFGNGDVGETIKVEVTPTAGGLTGEMQSLSRVIV